MEEEKDPQNFYTRDLVDEKYKNNIGDYTYGNPKIFDWDEGAKLKIGKFCSIAEEVTIFLGGNHRIDWVTTYPFPALVERWLEAKDIKGHPGTKGDVIIGNDVWIGYKSTILSGVTIGDGAVIGACSVVAKNVPPYTKVAGNPAVPIGKRFDEKIVEELERIRWWDWDEKIIRENLKILCGGNLKRLIDLSKRLSR